MAVDVNGEDAATKVKDEPLRPAERGLGRSNKKKRLR
jgi:hypothetical protein